MVFVFFGLVAVLGTTYVQTETFELPALYAAVGVGAFACAILVANNLRDIPTDALAGKRTLAVALGDERTRHLYGLLIDAALVALVGRRADHHLVVAARAGRREARPRRADLVLGSRATGPALVPVLQLTGVAELLYAAGIFAGIAIRWPSLGLASGRPPGCHTGNMWFLILRRHRRRLRSRLQEPRHAAGQDARPVRDPDQPAAQAQAPLTAVTSSSRRPRAPSAPRTSPRALLGAARRRRQRTASRCGASSFSDSSEETSTAAMNGTAASRSRRRPAP